MPRARLSKISRGEREEIIGGLFEAITNLKTKKDTIEFLVGLLSPSEILMLARRIQIANMLLEEKKYKFIGESIDVGTSTIASVSRWLESAESNTFKKQVQISEDGGKSRRKKKSKSYYHGILNPYRQLQVMRDFLDGISGQ